MRLTVRRAKIAAELRDNLELYGSQVVALVLALGVVRTAAMGGSNSYISTMILNNQQLPLIGLEKSEIRRIGAKHLATGACLSSRQSPQLPRALLRIQSSRADQVRSPIVRHALSARSKRRYFSAVQAS
jgi:hypothetical protein